MKHWGIKQRVLFLALLPAAAIALLLALYFTSSRLADLEQSLSERGFAIVRHLAPACEYGVFSGNREMLEHLAATTLDEADVRAVQISDAAGRVLTSRGSAVSNAVAAPDPSAIAVATEQDGLLLVFSAPVLHSQVALEEYFTTLPAEQKAAAADSPVVGRVTVALSREGLLQRKQRLLIDGLLITLLGLVGTSLLALRMSRGVTKPIRDLADAVKKLEQGELATRVAPQSGGELQLLEHGVNAMAQALQSAHADLERRVREATAELRAKKDEAEHANRAKSSFLAVASHDLRQPMHAMGLFIAALRDKADSAETRKLVEQIDASAAAMDDLLDALLDISKLDAGVLTPQWEDFDLKPLLDRIDRDFAPAAHSKGLRLHVRPLRAVVRSDPLLLERILINLVSNAMRYTKQGGVLVGCRRRGRQLRIEVWDSGIGIAADHQQAIFQEFYQIAKSERDRKKGLGLGLAIVDRLARLMQHPMTLRSVPGKGSCFSIELPLSATSVRNESAPTVADPAQSLDRVAVLVVEDDPLVAEAMLGLLECWGCQVKLADCGQQAWEIIAASGWQPQVILCDYRLPQGESGVQVLTRLRAELGGEVVAVLVSGDTTSNLLEQVQQLGCHFLHKPVPPAKLRALLSQLLSKRAKQAGG